MVIFLEKNEQNNEKFYLEKICPPKFSKKILADKNLIGVGVNSFIKNRRQKSGKAGKPAERLNTEKQEEPKPASEINNSPSKNF